MHWKDEYRIEWRKGYEAGLAYADEAASTEAMREYVIAAYKTRTVAERAYRAGVLRGLTEGQRKKEGRP